MYTDTFILTIATVSAVAFNLILGLLVFVNDRKNETNIIFGFLNIALSFYLAANLFSVTLVSYEEKLLWVRLAMFGSVFLDTFFYLFIRVFPDKKLSLFFWEKILVAVSTIGIAGLTLTSKLFSGITLTSGSDVPSPVQGTEYGIAIYGLVAVVYIAVTVILLIRKYWSSEKKQKRHLGLILIGAGVMFLSFIVFNFVFTVAYNNVYFIKLTPLFTSVFIAFSAYAILRLGMFNIKVVATELLVFTLWFFVLLRTLFSKTYEDQAVNGGLLFAMIVTGIFLIKSVIKEVEQRERLVESAIALDESHQRELEKAKSVAKLKDEFVFVAAHELRTPITAIRGFLELVTDAHESFPADVQSDLDAIKMASEHLNELVNNLLEIARDDSGTLKVDTKPLDVIPMIKQITDELNSLAIEKKIKVIVNNFKDGVLVSADGAKIKEVLTNLVGNAIKYNREGGTVEVSAIYEGGANVILEVRDTGFGIPKEQQEKIFQKFFRASSKDTQGIIGTGLGLFITRMLVEKMGGQITFSSVEGKGTTFAVSLPKV